METATLPRVDDDVWTDEPIAYTLTAGGWAASESLRSTRLAHAFGAHTVEPGPLCDACELTAPMTTSLEDRSGPCTLVFARRTGQP